MLTAAATLLVWLALLAPDGLTHLPTLAALRIPVEGLVITTLLLALPPRQARPAALLIGALIGLILILSLFDAGFHRAQDRPMRLVSDWALLGAGLDYVATTTGRAAAVGLAAAAVVAATAIVVVLALAVRRLAERARGRRTHVLQMLGALAAAWALLAASGTTVVPERPLAAHATLSAVVAHQERASQDLADRATFAGTLQRDPTPSTQPNELLGALRGKDVVLAFVESYGRFALEDPHVAPGVGAVLDDGERDLAAAGFGARSAFLTSPTVGGASWLAHATLLSGTWVDKQSRYTDLLASEHTTLVADFNRAGWRTVLAMPATKKAWPEGAFYGYDKIYTHADFGYAGPRFSWSLMPDQYVLSVVQDRELARAGRPPLLTEIELTSSHQPWAPLPRPVDWDTLGDGSVFDPMPAAGPDPRDITGDRDRVRTQYGLSIEYTLGSLTSFLGRHGTDDTVLILVGDHQPRPDVIGPGASRDVPITVVARDPSVLDRVAGWGWQDGMRPAPDAPVMRMDAFRDRFVTTFSSGTAP